MIYIRLPAQDLRNLKLKKKNISFSSKVEIKMKIIYNTKIQMIINSIMISIIIIPKIDNNNKSNSSNRRKKRKISISLRRVIIVILDLIIRGVLLRLRLLLG